MAAALTTALAAPAQEDRTGTTPPRPTNPRISLGDPGATPANPGAQPNPGLQQNPGTIPQNPPGTIPQDPAGTMPQNPAGTMPQNPAGTTPGTAPGTTPQPGVGVAPQRPQTQFGFTNRSGIPTNQFGLQTNRFGGFNTNQFGMGTNRFGLPIGSNMMGFSTNQPGSNVILLPTGRPQPGDVDRNPSGAPEGGMTDPMPGPGGTPR